MTVTVTHPLDTKNFTAFSLNGCLFWFSYNTCIAFTDGNGIHISENCWSTTTGKHLNWINIDKSLRLPRSEFENLLNSYLEDLDDAFLFVRRGATPAQIDNVILRLQQMTREMAPSEEGDDEMICLCEHSHRSALCPIHGPALIAEVKAEQDAEGDDEYELPDEFKPFFAPPAESDDDAG